MRRYRSLVLFCLVFAGAHSVASSLRPLMNAEASLSDMELLDFYAAQSFVHKPWVSAPATTTARDGLGPYYNAAACGDCHFQNGRTLLDSATHFPKNFIVKVSHASPLFERYGEQIQTRAVHGLQAEADIEIVFQTHNVVFADGESVELRKPLLKIDGEYHDGEGLSLRVAPPIAGFSLMASFSHVDISQYEDSTDKDGDGISGARGAGLFGWKGAHQTLEQQIAVALHQDMGLTSSIFPEDNHCHIEARQCDGKALDVEPRIFTLVLNYVKSLAPIPVTAEKDNLAMAGEQVFHELGCSACHRTELVSGTDGKHYQIYSDFLLHDMGPDLADGLGESRTASEWRTPVLWGLRYYHKQAVSYLHDGRARTLLEAILWHGGEAEKSRQAVLLLPKEKREALIHFLQTL